MSKRRATLRDVYDRRIVAITPHVVSWNQKEVAGQPVFETELPDGSPVPIGHERATPHYDPADIVYEDPADEVHRPTLAALQALRLEVDTEMRDERRLRREAKELLNDPTNVAEVRDEIWALVNWAADNQGVPVPAQVATRSAALRTKIQEIRQRINTEG